MTKYIIRTLSGYLECWKDGEIVNEEIKLTGIEILDENYNEIEELELEVNDYVGVEGPHLAKEQEAWISYVFESETQPKTKDFIQAGPKSPDLLHKPTGTIIELDDISDEGTTGTLKNGYVLSELDLFEVVDGQLI